MAKGEKEVSPGNNHYFQERKAEPVLTNLGVSMRHIKHAPKGDLMLKPNISSEKTADSFGGQLEKVLG